MIMALQCAVMHIYVYNIIYVCCVCVFCMYFNFAVPLSRHPLISIKAGSCCNWDSSTKSLSSRIKLTSFFSHPIIIIIIYRLLFFFALNTKHSIYASEALLPFNSVSFWQFGKITKRTELDRIWREQSSHAQNGREKELTTETKTRYTSKTMHIYTNTYVNMFIHMF